MRALAVCPSCIEENVRNGASGVAAIPAPVAGEMDDHGYIHVTCPKGHVGIVTFDSRRHQVLMESAACAFLDGYTNEVVAVMATALERAYEFYLRVSCKAKSIASATFEAAWKPMASQSERQFGAFQILYLLDHGVAFCLDPKIPDIRNKVVHKGRIAREQEALEFAEQVYTHIREIEASIEAKFPEEAKQVAVEDIERQKAAVPKGTPYVGLKKDTVVYDKTKKVVTGKARKFIDFVASIHQSRERGFPL
jgi:hypothetical protein